MTENVVNEEVKATQNVAAIDQNLAQTQTQPEAKKDDESKSEDPNWRAFREARKKDRAEKEAAERRAAEKEAEAAALKAALEAAFNKQQSQQAPYYSMHEVQEESEDEKIQKKMDAYFAKKQQQMEMEQREREKKEFPMWLSREYPDFNSVVSQENLDYLDFHYPEVSRPLQRLQEGYDKWHDIYHAVKKFIPNYAQAKKDVAKADANANKPRSMSGVNQTPQGTMRESWQEAEARRMANWERMQRILKGVN